MCYLFEIYKAWIATVLILSEAFKELSEDLIDNKLWTFPLCTKRSNSLIDTHTTITNYLKLIVALKWVHFV